MKYQAINTVKMIIGAMVAILAASTLELDYALSSGVIAMLSILHTRKASLVSGFKRFITSVLAMSLAGVLFYLVGFKLWALALFLLLFIPATILLNLERVMITSVVLVTHIYADGVLTPAALLNEVQLMAIGVGIAQLMHLYVPSYEKEIRTLQQETEKGMVALLEDMAEGIVRGCSLVERQKDLAALKASINKGLQLSYEYMDNSLLKDNSYFAAYFAMRKAQYIRLKDMGKYLAGPAKAMEEALLLKAFILEVAGAFSEKNDGRELLDTIAAMRRQYKSRPLPKTREAFENRAMLYQLLNDLQNFIEIKSDFIASSPERPS